MSNTRPSIARSGWRTWIDEHRSPGGWGADEFDVLAGADTPVIVLSRIWKKDWRTMNKYLDAWRRERASS
jgi:hypothetical protein